MLERNCLSRIVTLLVGMVFALLAAWLFIAQAGKPSYLFPSLGVLILAIILIWSSLISEEISISNNAITYKKGLFFLSSREISFSELKGIYYGPVLLLMRNNKIPAFRVWIEFLDGLLPKSVVYEQKLVEGTDKIQRQGEKLAQEIAGSLGLSANYKH
jgi:hypothetical protein